MVKIIFSLLLISSVGICQSPNQRPSFNKAELTLNGLKLEVEVARTDEQRSYGLMFIEKLNKNQGMLFVFNKEETQTFWMKNTLIPLSIGFFDKNQKLVDVQEMLPGSESLKSYSSKKPAMYALEMNKNWFYENKILLGMRFHLKEKN